MLNKQKLNMIKFLNFMCGKKGRFVMDPETGECGYLDTGAVVGIEASAVKNLYEIVVEQAKLTIRSHELEAKYQEWGSRYLEGEIIKQYGEVGNCDTPDSH